MGYYSNVNQEPSVFEAVTSNEDVGDRALVSYEGDDCEYMEAEWFWLSFVANWEINLCSFQSIRTLFILCNVGGLRCF